MHLEFAKSIHRKYSQMRGGEQVALEFSILSLLQLLEREKPEQILELGGGLGTLTEVILRVTDANLIVVESNAWCFEKLKRNMQGLRTYELISDYTSLNVGTMANMVVIDVNNGIYNVESLINNSTELTCIFIEGHHLAHRINISKTLWRNRSRQSFYDLRPRRGMKGCGYFKVRRDNSYMNWKSLLDFAATFTPLKFSLTLVRIRSSTGKTLDKLEFIPGIRILRKLWFGKIPWNF